MTKSKSAFNLDYGCGVKFAALEQSHRTLVGSLWHSSPYKKGIPCASHMAIFAPTLALPLPGLLGIRQSQYPFLLTAITSNSSSELTRNGNGCQHILLLGKGDGDHGVGENGVNLDTDCNV
ncbi:hypothetical protein OUZ56_030141 [Daphnia magna]|uniref:Uncharacterized protein n=1 Tax=Daphnia magna TaxID=35525 RepID=A0ABQ9ZQE9_9CRUS|nr:hypothetical protein OUZ56_030141 [Daphnia magna]